MKAAGVVFVMRVECYEETTASAVSAINDTKMAVFELNVSKQFVEGIITVYMPSGSVLARKMKEMA